MQDPIPEGEDLLRLAVDLSPAGILAVDPSGRILLVNREIERQFGWSRDDLIGQPIEALLPMGARHSHVGLRGNFFANPTTRAMGAGRDLHGLRRDGTEFPVEIGLNPVRTASGMVTLASVVDITARQEAERLTRLHDEHQRQSQKLEALGTLAGGIAHDFNNLLLAVMGHTELALQDEGLQAPVKDDLAQVMRAAERGRQLVQRILAFSRPREGQRQPTDLNRIVRETSELLRASLPSTIDMHVALDPKTPTVLADEAQIQQVVMNLATNSAHAMEKGGTLTLELAPFAVDERFAAMHPGLSPGECARLVVADNGTGMTRDVAERAFEPFFTTKPTGVGTGLGLPMVHGIVREHAGSLDMHTAPGEGTRFDIYMPAVRDAAAEPAPARAQRAHARNVRILYVEDEEALGRMEKRLLERLGYEVTLYHSSLEALEDFRGRADAFDLLITDNTMPRMTGLALTQEILKLRPRLPVLLVSGIAERLEP
ncbi:MAG TPA: PAS domain S-box protein, partial [Candidatus Eisenbacteria bacterium]|nr:PAS domain S-box protein [Candidatus Eisenbacteria bacterium]